MTIAYILQMAKETVCCIYFHSNIFCLCGKAMPFCYLALLQKWIEFICEIVFLERCYLCTILFSGSTRSFELRV